MAQFLFQAEDGIRDYKVTGVQTCALPIWVPRVRYRRFVSRPITPLHLLLDDAMNVAKLLHVQMQDANSRKVRHFSRSEERRVGKECSCGRWRATRRKKNCSHGYAAQNTRR